MKTTATQRLTAGKALLQRELAHYFQTPTAYIVGALFLAVSAGLFFSAYFIFERVEMRRFFSMLPLLLAVIIPALSMRLIAEERRRGTWEILSTLPIGNLEIILSKFLAAWITGLFLLLPTVLFAFSVSATGALDFGPVVGGYIGAVLLVAVYSAIGVFASSLTSNEIVALITALVLSLSLALLDAFLILIPTGLLPFFEFLSVGQHFKGFAKGLLDSRSIVYFISLSSGFLMLALYRLNRQR